ncbi:MAG: hypothetical protein QW095_06990, partial [Nitrososphaerota archaeon]
CKNISSILDTPLPSFWDQLDKEYRHKLDLSIAEALRIENSEKTVRELYEVLFNHKNHKFSS